MSSIQSILKRLNQSKQDTSSKLSQHVCHQYQHAHPQHQITQIYQHCEFLLALESCFYSHLDPKWQPYIRVGHYERGKLTLVTIDGSWLSIIQCYKKQWLKQLKTHTLFSQLHTITGQINPYLYASIHQQQSTTSNRH